MEWEGKKCIQSCSTECMWDLLARKFEKEPPGVRSSGKVRSPELKTPSEPRHTYLIGEASDFAIKNKQREKRGLKDEEGGEERKWRRSSSWSPRSCWYI